MIRATPLLALPLVLATEWPAYGSEGAHLPEPMVFDLVRSLGARQGELEANTLGVADLSGGEVDWAPEIEYAPLDHFAVEFEVPMSNAHVHALKFAGQLTFGPSDRRLVHGAQAIAEVLIDGGVELSALYLYGARITPALSVLGMSGVRMHETPEHTRSTGILQNTTLFAQLSDRVTLGVETNLSGRPNTPWRALVMPQVHLGIIEHVRLQVGVGVLREGRAATLRQGARLIIER